MKALLIAALAVAACSDVPKPRPTEAVTISTAMPGGSPELIEQTVVEPIERAVAGLDGIAEITSRIEGSTAVVTVALQPGRDIYPFHVATQNAISAALSELPREAETPAIRKQRVDDVPVLTLAIEGDRSRIELSEIADVVVRRKVESLTGVGRIEDRGVTLPALIVRPDRQRLAAYGVTVLDVTRAISSQNIQVPGGRDEDLNHLIRITGRASDVESVGALVVGQRGDVPVHLRDLADLHVGPEQPAEGSSPRLAVYVQVGAHPGEVRRRAREAISQLALPQGVKLREVPSERSKPSVLVASIRGPDHAVLAQLADALVSELGTEGVVRDPPSGKPEMTMDIDRERVASLGVRIADVAATIRAAASPEQLGEVTINGETRSVVMQFPSDSPEALLQVLVRGRDGAAVPLSAVVTMKASLSEVLLRHDREGAIDLRAPAAEVAKIRRRVEQEAAKWPPGYRAVVAR